MCKNNNIHNKINIKLLYKLSTVCYLIPVQSFLSLTRYITDNESQRPALYCSVVCRHESYAVVCPARLHVAMSTYATWLFRPSTIRPLFLQREVKHTQVGWTWPAGGRRAAYHVLVDLGQRQRVHVQLCAELLPYTLPTITLHHIISSYPTWDIKFISSDSDSSMLSTRLSRLAITCCKVSNVSATLHSFHCTHLEKWVVLPRDS